MLAAADLAAGVVVARDVTVVPALPLCLLCGWVSGKVPDVGDDECRVGAFVVGVSGLR